MKSWLLPFYADSLMEIELLVPYETDRSIDDFGSNTCLHASDSAHIRHVVTDNQDFFCLFPAHVPRSQEHYWFGGVNVPIHNCLFVDSSSTPVDKWQLVEKFPGLLDFFNSDKFHERTSAHPIVFWHVPVQEHDNMLSSIKEAFVDASKQSNTGDWWYELQYQILISWNEDDLPLLYRLIAATCRSADSLLESMAKDYALVLTIDNIDLEINRRRQLKKIVAEQVLQNTLIAKLLSGMKLAHDARVSATETAILNFITVKLDQILASVIKQQMGK